MTSSKQQRDMYQADRTTPFTNREMEVMCEVTAMTLHNWQKGTATKDGPLPVKRKGRSVRYPVKSTLAWLKRNEVPVFVHPDDLAAGGTSLTQHAPQTPRKPGPKPRAAALAVVLRGSERPMASDR